MPRTAIPITDVSRAGVTQPAQTNGDAANGMTLAYNDGRIFLEVNSSSGTTNFSVQPVPQVDGQVPPTKTVQCTVGVTKLFGPFPPYFYNQPDGSLNVDVDNTTLGRVRAYHIP